MPDQHSSRDNEVENKLQICHVIASINENLGGSSVAVSCLAEALTTKEISSHIFTLNYPNIGEQLVTSKVNLHSYDAHLIAQYLAGYHPDASDGLQKLAATDLDLIHNHGLWLFPNLYARESALNNSLPLITSPHGMLDSWSLSHSYWKKQLVWYLYEHKNLTSANVFHATSLQESLSIRALGFPQPIALVPNGVDIKDLNRKPEREILINLFPELKAKKWLLFLSRIHPKKGLDNLLFAWKNIANLFDEWHLIIAGPDLVGYQEQLEYIVAELGLERQLTLTGMLSGKIKQVALGNADLFVLPSYSENFGIVIAESLANAVPVVTTKNTPWQDLLTYNCGWWIDNNQQALTSALTEAIEMSAQQRKEMGIKGYNLVKKKYSWDFVAQEMLSVYEWMLGGGNFPNCVLD